MIEFKAIRRVRTPGGAKFYGQSVGSIIRTDLVGSTLERIKTALGGIAHDPQKFEDEGYYYHATGGDSFQVGHSGAISLDQNPYSAAGYVAGTESGGKLIKLKLAKGTKFAPRQEIVSVANSLYSNDEQRAKFGRLADDMGQYVDALASDPAIQAELKKRGYHGAQYPEFDGRTGKVATGADGTPLRTTKIWDQSRLKKSASSKAERIIPGVPKGHVEILPADPTDHFAVLPEHERGKSGDGRWIDLRDGSETKLWGKYGAAGVLLRVKDGKQPKFMFVRRGPGVSRAGKWQLPGGAREEHESAMEAIARELEEETEFNPKLLATSAVKGRHLFEHDSGWTYESIIADLDADVKSIPAMKVDGFETDKVEFLSVDEIRKMLKNKEFIPELEATLRAFLAHTEDDDVLDPNWSPYPPATAQTVLAGDFRGLKRVEGAQGGSHEGALYEASDGTKWYMKVTPSKDHGESEVLASRLYRMAGLDETPEMMYSDKGHEDFPDGAFLVVSRWKDGAKPYGKQEGSMSTEQKREYKARVKAGFAADVWLASWDAFGTNWGNLLAYEKYGAWFPLRVDYGGSLKWRALGASKGSMWNADANEWDSLRDPKLGPFTSQMYGDMSAAEMAASLGALEDQLTADKIFAMCRQTLTNQDEADEIAQVLVDRLESMKLKLAAQIEADKKTAVYKTPEGVGDFDDRVAAAAKGKDANFSPSFQYDPAGYGGNSDSKWRKGMAKFFKGGMAALTRAIEALSDYRGSGYSTVNPWLRHRADSFSDYHIDRAAEMALAMDEVFEWSRTDRDILIYRGFGIKPTFLPLEVGSGSEEAAFYTFNEDPDSLVGYTWRERGYSSSTTKRHTAENFGGSQDKILCRIVLPKGSPAIQLSSEGYEGEILLDRDVTYRIVRVRKYDKASRYLEVDVEVEFNKFHPDIVTSADIIDTPDIPLGILVENNAAREAIKIRKALEQYYNLDNVDGWSYFKHAVKGGPSGPDGTLTADDIEPYYWNDPKKRSKVLKFHKQFPIMAAVVAEEHQAKKGRKKDSGPGEWPLPNHDFDLDNVGDTHFIDSYKKWLETDAGKQYQDFLAGAKVSTPEDIIAIAHQYKNDEIMGYLTDSDHGWVYRLRVQEYMEGYGKKKTPAKRIIVERQGDENLYGGWMYYKYAYSPWELTHLGSSYDGDQVKNPVWQVRSDDWWDTPDGKLWSKALKFKAKRSAAKMFDRLLNDKYWEHGDIAGVGTDPDGKRLRLRVMLDGAVPMFEIQEMDDDGTWFVRTIVKSPAMLTKNSSVKEWFSLDQGNKAPEPAPPKPVDKAAEAAKKAAKKAATPAKPYKKVDGVSVPTTLQEPIFKTKTSATMAAATAGWEQLTPDEVKARFDQYAVGDWIAYHKHGTGKYADWVGIRKQSDDTLGVWHLSSDGTWKQVKAIGTDEDWKAWGKFHDDWQGKWVFATAPVSASAGPTKQEQTSKAKGAQKIGKIMQGIIQMPIADQPTGVVARGEMQDNPGLKVYLRYDENGTWDVLDDSNHVIASDINPISVINGTFTQGLDGFDWYPMYGHAGTPEPPLPAPKKSVPKKAASQKPGLPPVPLGMTVTPKLAFKYGQEQGYTGLVAMGTNPSNGNIAYIRRNSDGSWDVLDGQHDVVFGNYNLKDLTSEGKITGFTGYEWHLTPAVSGGTESTPPKDKPDYTKPAFDLKQQYQAVTEGWSEGSTGSTWDLAYDIPGGTWFAYTKDYGHVYAMMKGHDGAVDLYRLDPTGWDFQGSYTDKDHMTGQFGKDVLWRVPDGDIFDDDPQWVADWNAEGKSIPRQLERKVGPGKAGRRVGSAIGKWVDRDPGHANVTPASVGHYKDPKTGSTLPVGARIPKQGSGHHPEMGGEAAGPVGQVDAEPDTKGRRPATVRVRKAQKNADMMLAELQESFDEKNRDDYGQINDADFYNKYSGVAVSSSDDPGYESLTPEDITPEYLAELVAATGPWPNHFLTCRQIRKSAYEMLGFDGYDDSDPHLEKYVSAQGHGVGGKIQEPLADTLAYVLLKGLVDSPESDQTLYRGVHLHGSEFPEDVFQEGRTISLPLISTADSETAVGQFGRDITFHIRAKKSVQGSSWNDTEEYDEEEFNTSEYVTGGNFEITRVSKNTQPTYDEITRNIGEAPDRDEYEDEDDWQSDYDAWQDSFKAEAENLGVEVDEDGDIVPWDPPERWVVEMTQRSVFDPDTGAEIEFKAAAREWAKVPAVDWMFTASVRNPDYPSPTMPTTPDDTDIEADQSGQEVD